MWLAERPGPVSGKSRSPELLAKLTEQAENYAHASRAESTWLTYQRKWARFEQWCADLGLCPCPAEPLTVARFLADLAGGWREATADDPPEAVIDGYVRDRPGLRPSTIAGYLAAISVAHRGAGVPNPAEHESVRRVMAGIRRVPHPPVRRRTAARTAAIAAMIAPLEPARHLADARDLAILLIGWKAALRTDDLHRLNIEDLTISDEGLTVRLTRGKTDQEGRGVAIGIAHPTENEEAPLDAAAAWARWRDRLAEHGYTHGPAWRPIDRYGARPRPTRLSTKSISAIITRRAQAVGLPGDWGGHSLRRGFATQALSNGVPERDVQRHGRWRSRAAMDPYVDEAERFAETNPTRHLGW